MQASVFSGRSVLVIEDEPFTRMVLARMLGTLGFADVRQAGDGGAGIEAVRAKTPDVVVCDVEMTPMDGIAFLRALREDGSAALPVVFMTNRADEARKSAAAELGADVFLIKPPTPATLREALGRLIG